MSTYNQAYRATIYNATDAAALTPTSGSHSDNFMVATISGSAGYKPYMGLPRGTKSKLTLPDTKCSVGQMTFTVQDQRLTDGGDNTIRWVTAFLGGPDHRLQLIGKKVIIEESVDNGANWSTFFTGRVSNISLDTALSYSITVSDSVEEMKKKIFDVIPSPGVVNYIIHDQIHPYGLSATLFNVPAVEHIHTTALAVSGTGITKALEVQDEFIYADQNRIAQVLWNIWPVNAYVNEFGTGHAAGSPAVDDQFRVSILNVTQGWTTPALFKLYGVYSVGYDRARQPPGSNYRAYEYLQKVLITALNSTDPGYRPLSDIATNDDCIVSIIMSKRISDATKVVGNMYLVDVHPMQLVKDILDGYYFTPSATATITIPYDASALAALIADTSIPVGTFRIKDAMTVVDFIEKHICKPYSVGYNVLSDGRVRFFKTSIPATAPAAQLTDADITPTPFTWVAGIPLKNFKFIYYVDSPPPSIGSISDTAEPYQNNIISITRNAINFEVDTRLPDSSLEIDALGVRTGIYMPSTILAAPSDGIAQTLAAPILLRWNTGTPTLGLTCRRTGNVTSLAIGDWVLIDLDKMPDQATNLRGGVRIMQVVGKYEDGLTIKLELVDGAVNSVSPVPTLGTPSLSVDAYGNHISIDVTCSTYSGRVTVQTCIVAAGSGTPASTDSRWTTVASMNIDHTTTTLQIPNVPSGTRVYIRARTDTLYNITGMTLPSAWVAANTYIDVTYLSPPTALSVTNITDRSADISWTNGTTQPIEVLLASPAGDPLYRIAELSAGSTQYTLVGLDTSTSTSHQVGIRHKDQYGNISTTVTSNFTSTGTAAALTAPTTIIIYVGGGIV